MWRKLTSKLIWSVQYLRNPKAREAAAILKKSEGLDNMSFVAWNNEAFKALVEHCFETVPYYRRIMTEGNLTPDDFNTIEDIIKLPLLTKDIIRSEGDNLISSEFKNKKLISSRTGGTTGEPIESLLDEREYYLEYLAYLRGLKWMGWDHGIGLVKFFGGSLGLTGDKPAIGKIKDFLQGTILIPAFEIGEENVKEVIQQIAKNGKSIVVGYASAIYNFSQLVEQLGPEWKSKMNIKAFFFTAEYMDPSWADYISGVFNCEVKGFYGCGEVNSIGFQTNQHGAYIDPADHVILEGLTINSIDHNLVVTPLYNYAKPLLRFVNGDMGEVKNYPENPKKREILSFLGRTSDMFLKPDGSRASSIVGTYSIQKTRIPVSRYQYIQKSLDLIEMRYQMYDGGKLSEDHKKTLLKIYRDAINPKLEIEFNNTNDFELSPSGKHRIMISRLV